MTTAVFVYGEIELAGATGIHVSQFGHGRKKLRRGSDWDLNNLRVAYSRSGFEAILAAVLPAAPAAAQLEDLADKALLDQPEKKAAAQIDASVTRIGGKGGAFINPQLLELELPDKKRVFIRVRTTINFRKGMQCPLRWNETAKTYELARRLPRFAGRW